MASEMVLTALRQAWTALKPLNVPIALMGGLAMTAWKRPRFTKDVDLLIALGEPTAHRALSVLRSVGFSAPRPQPVVRVEDNRFIQLFFEPLGSFSEVQLDLLLATTEFHEQALARPGDIARSRARV